jgi:hypothetical protein
LDGGDDAAWRELQREQAGVGGSACRRCCPVAAAPSAGAAQGRRFPAQAVLARGGGWEGGRGGAGRRGKMGGRGGAGRRENDCERIKFFPLCVLISRECVFTAIGLATNHWSL